MIFKIVFTKEAVEQVRRELNIQFLNTNWMDSTDFVIDIEELVNAVNFIHAGLHNRGSVLVHCAQVCNIWTGFNIYPVYTYTHKSHLLLIIFMG